MRTSGTVPAAWQAPHSVGMDSGARADVGGRLDSGARPDAEGRTAGVRPAVRRAVPVSGALLEGLLRPAVPLGATAALVALVVAIGWAPGVVTISSAVLALGAVSVSIVARAMLRSAPRNPAGWILLASGITLPVAVAAYDWSQAVFVHGADLPGGQWAGWLDSWPWVPALGLLPTVGVLLFPDGRVPGRRWKPVLIVGLAVSGVLTLALLFEPGMFDYPDRANPTALPGAAGAAAGQLFFVIALIAPLSTLGAVSMDARVRRARRDGDPRARALALLRPAAWAIAASWWSSIAISAAGFDNVLALPAEEIGLLALVITAWIAIRRLGLVDARVVINRAVVYGLLTLAVLASYLVAGAVLTRLASTTVSGSLAVVVALAVALPLRTVLQRLANSLVYGARDDPLAALDILGRRLEGAAAAADVLPGAARAVREALRVPYVAIEVAGTVVAVAGRPSPEPPVEFPLVFAQETIGRLLVAIRDGTDRFTPTERTLLAGVGRQLAAAAHAVALTSDLRSSRERLVAATEEERRRLRRDLHDGLGPALAGVVLGISRAERLLGTDEPSTRAQLDTVRNQTQLAVGEIRRLVDGLRPPALDELGLIGALREQADAFGIAVHGPADPGLLPAAVEVAAYRIAVEAMTNLVRHARASSASVTVSVDSAVRLEVVDDGVGLPAVRRAGLGLTSMHDRAAELGGTCTIARHEPRGTLVRAVIPLVRP